MIEHNSTRHAAETMRTKLDRIQEIALQFLGPRLPSDPGCDLARDVLDVIGNLYTPRDICPVHGPHPHLAVAGRCLDCPECFPETAD
jgi:hypothetical protein